MCRYPISLGNTHHICCCQRGCTVLLTLHWRITLTGNHKCKHLGSNDAVPLSSENVAANDSGISGILTTTPTPHSATVLFRYEQLARSRNYHGTASPTLCSSSPGPSHYVRLDSSTTFASSLTLHENKRVHSRFSYDKRTTILLLQARSRPCQIRLRYTPKCNDNTTSVCWYNLFMVWQKYEIRITKYPPKGFRLATQFLRPKCVKMCGGQGGKKGQDVTQGVTSWLPAKPPREYLPPITHSCNFYLSTYFNLLILLSNHTSLQGNLLQGPCAGAGSGAVKPRPHLLNHYHPALILLSATPAFTQSS